MAEIPIEKKSGFPRWGWLLALLLLALIAWFIIGMFDGDDDVIADQTVATEQMADPVTDTSAGPITTMAALLGTGGLVAMNGREVALQDVPVESLSGDMAFFIGDSADSRALVVFDQVPTPGTPKEGALDVNPGSRVNITGTVREAGDLPEAATAEFPAGIDSYIYATNVDVLN
ncbi:hypothetical protein [Novosphingopyxis iocasae]|uniref:hypothetical protein n=1 Tax=Novosphingopyxis iocasae TaxID=2762729 RepID=UPI00165159A3|nr:hypothetical protein [Novosphingopyxis iocasae]